jgi:hypothetical protein
MYHNNRHNYTIYTLIYTNDAYYYDTSGGAGAVMSHSLLKTILIIWQLTAVDVGVICHVSQ